MIPNSTWSETDNGFVYKFDSAEDFLKVLINYFILKSDSDFETDSVSTLELRAENKTNNTDYYIIEKCDKRFLDVSLDDDDIKIYVSEHPECLEDINKLIRKAEAILGLKEKSLEKNLHFHVDYSTDEYLPVFQLIIPVSIGTEYNKQYVSESSKVNLNTFKQRLAKLESTLCMGKSGQLTEVISAVLTRAEQAPDYFVEQPDFSQEERSYSENKNNRDARHNYFMKKQNKSKNIKSIYW